MQRTNSFEATPFSANAQIAFVNKFGRRPMHFFGSLGTLMFFFGSLLTVWLIFLKIYNIYTHQPYRNVTDNPLFFIALTVIIVGSQLFLGGFLGELLVKQSISQTGDYLIADEVGTPQEVLVRRG